MKHLYILNGHEPVPVANVIEWADWFETADRQIAYTMVGKRHISTIFIGVDMSLRQPPRVFETAVFDGDNVDITHCSTWDEAVKQHRAMVKLVKKRNLQ